MNTLAVQLKKILQQNPLGEKVIIVSSYSAGRQFIESCARQGLKIINLRVKTLPTLAEEIAKYSLYKDKRIPVSISLAHELIIDILKTLKSDSQLKYFAAPEITPGISRAIYQTLLDLKMTGLTPSQINTVDFIDPAKGEDIIKIWLEYEQTLEQLSCYDLPDLYRTANRQSISALKPTFIVFSHLKMTPMEKTFLRNLTKDKVEVLSVPKPQAINIPQSFLEVVMGLNRDEAAEDIIATAPNSLLWLWDISNAPRRMDFPVEMFHAYGESNEAKEILRRIKRESLPFDETLVLSP
jgi:ATP-dependent helicase/nuclease subunit B